MKKSIRKLIIGAVMTAGIFAAATAAFAADAAPEAADLTGDWYADLSGAAAKVTFNEDGTYSLSFAGEEQDGTWELTEEGVLMDGESLLTVTDDALVFDDGEGYTYTMTRDVVESYVAAEIDYEAELDQFQGKWTAFKVGSDAALMDVEPEDMSYMEIEINDTEVTFDGYVFTGETIELEIQDGGLSGFFGDDESAMFELIAINYLDDGNLRANFVISVEENDEITYILAPEGAEEELTEAATE